VEGKPKKQACVTKAACVPKMSGLRARLLKLLPACTILALVALGVGAILLVPTLVDHGSSSQAHGPCPPKSPKDSNPSKQKKKRQGKRRTKSHSKKTKPKHPTLGSTGPASPINMGDTKGWGQSDIVVGASPALRPRVRPSQITIHVPKRFERSGDNLTSEYLRRPIFTRRRILERGKLVAFTLCINMDGAQAGTYVGQLIVGGPGKIQPATIAVTINVKNRTLFLQGLAVAILLAFALLLALATKKRWDVIDSKKTPKCPPCLATAMGQALTDAWGFWLPTAIAIVAAGVAMYQVWDNTVAWGADTGASLIALGGTTLSAAGIGSFLTSIRGPGST
jgi:hypothetical protein